jgi:AraC-like DNA-binding protein
MDSALHLTTNDPEYMQQSLLPVTGAVCIRPAAGSTFKANITLLSRENLGLFTLRSDSLRVTREPPHPFYSMTVPLGMPFSAFAGQQRLAFDTGTAHLLPVGENLCFQSRLHCRVIVANFFRHRIDGMAEKLYGRDISTGLRYDPALPLSTPAGRVLLRSLAALWSGIQQAGDTGQSDIAIGELEDDLITAFLLTIQLQANGPAASTEKTRSSTLARAEEYLLANLTRPVARAELAAVAGTSIRTLSRAFVKRHGYGPIGFLKTRRLDACYQDLLGAETGETSVTEVALRYGFNHLGKFAMEYKKAFRESPSVTLHH